MDRSSAVKIGDSWESAEELDSAITRLAISSNKDDSTATIAPVEDRTASKSSSPVLASQRNGDTLNQVDHFLLEAIQNPRERLSILRMEQDILKFIHDPSQQQLEFRQLPTSYLRLAAHRLAQHYSLQSSVMLDSNSSDGSGNRVIIHKTTELRFPLVRLVDIPVNMPQEDKNFVKVAIIQRPSKLQQSTNSGNSHSSKANHSKSVEERKEEYNRARARIFSSSSGVSGSRGKSEIVSMASDSFQHSSSLTSARFEEKFKIRGPEVIVERGSGDSSTVSSSNNNRTSRNKVEKEPVTRNKPNGRVAIFRDREVDRKDPDYNRSYERYMQRFDPGFGFSGGQCMIRPIYSPILNYNTEFPQLGSAHRPQISIDHQPRPIPEHLRGPWPATSNPTAIQFPPPPESMFATPGPSAFNNNHVGTHCASALNLHSSQYACPRPGVAFIHPPEHAHQPFPQLHHQKPEGSLGLARPR